VAFVVSVIWNSSTLRLSSSSIDVVVDIYLY